MLAQIASLFDPLEQGMSREQLQQALPAGAARNAIDSALWDLESRKAQQTLWQLTQRAAPASLRIAQTVSIDSPENMAKAALTYWQKGARLLKVKLDDTLITERPVAIRTAVPEATLIVDANESRTAKGWRRAASCWPISMSPCSNSHFRRAKMQRWKILSIRCRFAPMRVATPATIFLRWRAL